MKTNFQMVRELYKGFTPENKGFLNGEEVNMIKEKLCIPEMNILQLRNLRDFVVMFTSLKCKDGMPIREEMVERDKCSGICAVIDNAIFAQGGEV